MMLTPTRKNAPTAASEIIHDLIPLELALQETAPNAYHRLKLMTQASWTNNHVKKHSLIPQLKFLKNNRCTSYKPTPGYGNNHRKHQR